MFSGRRRQDDVWMVSRYLRYGVRLEVVEAACSTVDDAGERARKMAGVVSAGEVPSIVDRSDPVCSVGDHRAVFNIGSGCQTSLSKRLHVPRARLADHGGCLYPRSRLH
jgi:hypothetical protein